MARPTRLCLTALLLLAAAGCGSDPSPGGAEPKRALDPRAEAVRFFAAGTRSVALLRTDMPDSARELAARAGDIPGVSRLVGEIGARASSCGVDVVELLELGRAEGGGGPGAELVMGLPRGAGGDGLLFVLPTDRPEDLEDLFAAAAATAELRPAGEYDDAALYAGRGCAFALRDGVMVAAATPNLLRQAIGIRDGDESRHLDDADVSAALEDVPTRAPLHLVAHRGERFAGAAVRVGDDGTEIRVTAELSERDSQDEEGPERVTLDPEFLAGLLEAEAGLPPEAATLLGGIAPLSGAAYADGDELVASFTVPAP
jgi:hypothetical protein